MSKWAEIRNNYCDEEEGKVFIDAWKTNSGNEEGTVIAKVNYRTREVEYLDPDAQTDFYAQDIIKDVIANINNGLYKEVIKVLNIEDDGLSGHIEDVSNEEWYKNPPITLYDELEYDSYALACSYAELIGVHLDKEDIGDFDLAKEVQEAVIKILTKRFGIQFPGFKQEKIYFVQRHEEELGTTFFKVTAKEDMGKTVINHFEMAAKYAQSNMLDWEIFDEEERKEYDEHFEEMGKIRCGGNGDDAFLYYLENVCGYTIEEVEENYTISFVFEW